MCCFVTSPYGVIFVKKLAPKVPVRQWPFPCFSNAKPAALPPSCMRGDEEHRHNNYTCCIWLTTAPAGRSNKMYTSVCQQELPQYKEDSLLSSDFLVVIFLPHSFCIFWVLWENNFRLWCLRRLPAEAEKVWDLYSCFQEYFLMGVLYSLHHRKEKTKLSTSRSTAQVRAVWTNPCLPHAFTRWMFSVQTLTVLVEIAVGENLSKTLPFTLQLQLCVLKHWHFTCNLISIINELWKLLSLGTRPSDCVWSLSATNITEHPCSLSDTLKRNSCTYKNRYAALFQISNM